MDFNVTYVIIFFAWLSSMAVDAIDPNYVANAKFNTREELKPAKVDIFEPTGRRCRRVGERAARKRVSCVADTDFYTKLFNRVHKSRIQPSHSDKSLSDLAFKISKCSVKYSKYFEIGCTFKSVYIQERRRCRSLTSRRERTICKGKFRQRFHRRPQAT